MDESISPEDKVRHVNSVTGQTIWHILAMSPCVEMPEQFYQEMVSMGTNPYQLDKRGQSPLVLALRHENLSLFRFLLQYYDVNSLDENGTPLFFKARVSRRLLRIFIEASVNMKMCDHNGNTILHVMAMDPSPNRTYWERMEMILKVEPSLIHMRNKDDKLPVDLSGSQHREEFVRRTKKFLSIPESHHLFEVLVKVALDSSTL